MKQILTILLLLCAFTVNAQDVIITGPKRKTQTTTTTKQKPKQKNSSGTHVAKPKQQSKPTVPSPIIGTSTYTPNVITFTASGVSFQMVEVRGGTFNMGATSEQESYASSNEKPHQVTLSSYYIGKYEVTQDLWQAVMGSNPSNFKGSRRPVEQVSWDDCQIFITKLNTLTGKRFRLPTEAEWEFAARGGNNSRSYKYSGSNSLSDVAWHEGNSGSSTHDVGTKSPNELGIYDMSGNVWEWCQDWYDYYSSSPQTNPTGASSGSCRVFRGGSWSDWSCRSSYRDRHTPSNRSLLIGLRLVLVP